MAWETNPPILLSHLLAEASKKAASDIYITEGRFIYQREQGVLRALDCKAEPELLTWIFDQTWDKNRVDSFTRCEDIDFSWSYEGHRLRGNAYHTRGCRAIALRLLPAFIPNLFTIHPLPIWNNLLKTHHGLVLVCGHTGAGKSTTIASFLNILNQRDALHILTLEDPIEYIFPTAKSLVSQRELGSDFPTFSTALKSALRERPDVLFLGEIRDADSMHTALMAAESGILVFATLHARRATEAIARIEGFFPYEERDSIRSRVAMTMEVILTQCLIPKADGGLLPQTEILLRTPAVTNLIRQGKYAQLESVMMSNSQLGMQTMEMSLKELYRAHRISTQVFQSLQSKEMIG